jgi:hypothetical protein
MSRHAQLPERIKREILDKAEKWWERTGRHIIRKGINERQDPPSVRTGTGPIFVSKRAIEADLNDGILRCLPWEELKPEEQSRVMFQYFSNIWLPAHPEVKLERRVQ